MAGEVVRRGGKGDESGMGWGGLDEGKADWLGSREGEQG